MESIKSIEINQYLNKSFTTIKLDENVSIIDYQVEMINNNLGNGLIYIEKKQFNDEIQLEYEVTDFISLKDYVLREEVNGNILLSLFKNMISVITSLPNFLLNRNNLFINKDYIFVDLNKKIVSMIYIPSRNDMFNIEQEFKLLVKDIALECITENNNDKQKFVEKILSLINSNSYSISEMEKSLNNTGAKAFKSNAPIINNVSEERSIIQDEKKKGLFSSFFKNKEKEKKNKDNPINKGHNTEEFMQNLNLSKNEIVTQVMYETEVLSETSNYLIFTKEGSIHKAKITKKCFIIGRNKDQVDYVIENSSVGKVHAKILSNGKVDRVVDLQSKNGTFINGKKLVAEKEYQLENGDEIIFGNVKSQYKRM